MSQDDAEKPNTSPPAAPEGAVSSAPPADEPDDAKAEEVTSGEGDAEDAPSPSEAPEAPKEPSLEDRLAASQEATAKMKEKMLRVAADFENFRRRSSREVDEARNRGTEGAVKDLLPVFDNLERATAHVDEATDVQSMVQGLEMVHKQFLDVLGKMGIERVESVGQGFDPNVHESIQYEHSEEHEAGIVMTELQPGYRKGKMLLRPALVVVSRGPAPVAEAEEGGDDGSGDPADDGEKNSATEGAGDAGDATAGGAADGGDDS